MKDQKESALQEIISTGMTETSMRLIHQNRSKEALTAHIQT